MNIRLISIVILLTITNVLYSADEVKEKKVLQVFWGTQLVDRQTAICVKEDNIKIVFSHRFGQIDNGISNLFGIYGSSNISMGLAYGLTNYITLLFNTEKTNRIQEFGAKWNILRQNKSGSKPVSVALYTNTSISTVPEDNFGTEYKFNDRLFFTNQIIVAKQFDYKFNIQCDFSYYHFNSVETKYQSDKLEFGLSIGYKISKTKSLFISYQKPFDFTNIENNNSATVHPKQTITFGYSAKTRTHRFQIYLSTRENISIGQNVLHNQRKLSPKKLQIGFNIVVDISRYL